MLNEDCLLKLWKEGATNGLWHSAVTRKRKAILICHEGPDRVVRASEKPCKALDVAQVQYLAVYIYIFTKSYLVIYLFIYMGPPVNTFLICKSHTSGWLLSEYSVLLKHSSEND